MSDSGVYEPIEADDDGAVASKTLGLALGVDDQIRLQARDAETGEWLPRPEKLYADLSAEKRAREAAEQRAGDAEQRAGDAELRAGDAELRAAALEQELAKLSNSSDQSEPQ